MTNHRSQGASSGWTSVVRLFHERFVLLLAVLFVVGVLGSLWHLYRLSSSLLESSALQSARHYSEALAEFRTLYTSEVVERVRVRGIEVTHDYAAKPHAIPLPATLSMILGRNIGIRGSGIEVRLYSDYPFPWRADGGRRDDFEDEALQRLRQNPGKPFYRFEDREGSYALRYATADLMRPACVGCHNTHPDSPKTDWSVGDVRGVLEVTRPLDEVIARTRAGLRESFFLLAGMCALALTGLILVIRRLRQASAELESRVQARTAELSRAKEELEREIAERKRTEKELAVFLRTR